MKNALKKLFLFHKRNHPTTDLLNDKWELEYKRREYELSSWQQAELDAVNQIIDERGGFDGEET